MSLDFSELFLQPLVTGVAYALLLPLLGAYLRLRREWLAALAYAQTGAAGALVAMAVGAPMLVGGMGGALLAAVSKRLDRSREGTAYGLLLLGGWGLAVLLVANLPMAERLGHALFDGQLYFTDGRDMVTALIWGSLGASGLRCLSNGLLLDHFYPDYARLQGKAGWPVHLGFDLLVAASLALATMTLGVMAAFALIFVPPWIAFGLARHWRQTLWLSAGLGLGGYLVAFVLALLADQPFGPVLALVMVSLGLLRPLGRKTHGTH